MRKIEILGLILLSIGAIASLAVVELDGKHGHGYSRRKVLQLIRRVLSL